MNIPKPLKKDRPGIKRRNVIASEWERIREEKKDETQTPEGYWKCYYCNNNIWFRDEVVIAHIIPKGREPSLKLEKSNLYPSHAHCNTTSSYSYKTVRRIEDIERSDEGIGNTET